MYQQKCTWCVQFVHSLKTLSIQKDFERTGLTSQSEGASYGEWGILLPLFPIRHVPPRSKGCLSDIEGDANHKMEISTGQSASPSLERLPSASPTTQPSQWWGTSMKYLEGQQCQRERTANETGLVFLSPQTFPSLCIHGASVLKASLASRGGTRLD